MAEKPIVMPKMGESTPRPVLLTLGNQRDFDKLTGKTRAGAEWLADQAEALGPGGRLALIGPTLHDVREVMIEQGGQWELRVQLNRDPP